MEYKDGKYHITHLGKTFVTKHFHEITDEKAKIIKRKFFEKPDFKDVQKQMKLLKNGGVQHHLVHRYYFYDLMCHAKLKKAKWTIHEFLDSKDLIGFALGKIKNNPKIYNLSTPLIKNIETVFRISPSGTAPKVSNFPVKTINNILEKYNTNGNYYDFSCGWGVRLLGSLCNDVNYFGTEPNAELVTELNRFAHDFKETTGTTSTVQIQNHGSEIFVPDWEDKIGLAFSSPPYFDLEDYQFGEQSIKNRNYHQWLEEYWRGTVKNIHRYLIQDGYFLLNIKNIKGYNLLDDMKEIAEQEGFTYIESLELKNINRVSLSKHNKHTNEEILVFKKG